MNARDRVCAWIESRPIQRIIIALILVNAVTLGLETSATAMARAGDLLIAIDRAILAVFVLEIGLKLYAKGLKFFRRPWNVFDFLVVGIALIPASGPLAVLRVLRVLRLISMLPQLRFVVEALLKAVPGISSIALLMLVLYYVFAVMATGLFGARFPDWFGTAGASMYTLFQIMTLESWSMGVARPVMEQFPYAWAFFIAFILIATFTMLNLFIAIIVNAMESQHRSEAAEEEAQREAARAQQTRHIDEEIRDLKRELQAVRAAVERLGER